MKMNFSGSGLVVLGSVPELINALVLVQGFT